MRLLFDLLACLMLISHRYKFIFLKTEKTASTSILRALRTVLQETDELLPADRATRARLLREHGSLAAFSFQAATSALRRKLPGMFGLHRHARARDVRAFIGRELFDEYLIVTSERNPWDRQVSLYAHRNRHGGGFDPANFDRDMGSWLYNTLHYNRLDNWGIYTIDDRVCADRVIRYESLAADFQGFLDRIGVPAGKGQLSKARSTERPRDESYRALYTPRSRALVAGWYRKEIEHFGYRFEAD